MAALGRYRVTAAQAPSIAANTLGSPRVPEGSRLRGYDETVVLARPAMVRAALNRTPGDGDVFAAEDAAHDAIVDSLERAAKNLPASGRSGLLSEAAHNAVVNTDRARRSPEVLAPPDAFGDTHVNGALVAPGPDEWLSTQRLPGIGMEGPEKVLERGHDRAALVEGMRGLSGKQLETFLAKHSTNDTEAELMRRLQPDVSVGGFRARHDQAMRRMRYVTPALADQRAEHGWYVRPRGPEELPRRVFGALNPDQEAAMDRLEQAGIDVDYWR